MRPLFFTHRNNLLMYLTLGRGANVREQFTSTAIGLPDLDSSKLTCLLSGAISSYTEYKIVNYWNKL